MAASSVDPAIRPVLLVGLGLAIFAQIIGIDTIIDYVSTIMRATGIKASGAIGPTMFIGVTDVVFTVIVLTLLGRPGRRVAARRRWLSALARGAGLYFDIGALQRDVS